MRCVPARQASLDGNVTSHSQLIQRENGGRKADVLQIREKNSILICCLKTFAVVLIGNINGTVIIQAPSISQL